MPLKRKRASRAAYFRAYRAKRKAAAIKRPAPLAFSVRKGSEPAAVVQWAKECLVVPPGHPLAGRPMVVPAYMRGVYEDLFDPAVREILLCIARKNIKSAAVAVLLLAHLVGPVRRPASGLAWRASRKSRLGSLKSKCEISLRRPSSTA